MLTVVGILTIGVVAFCVWRLRHGRAGVDGPED
jgi:hypothetical protein